MLILTIVGILGGLLLGKWMMPRKVEVEAAPASEALNTATTPASSALEAAVPAPPAEPAPAEPVPVAPATAPEPPPPTPILAAAPLVEPVATPPRSTHRSSKKMTRFRFVSGPLPVAAELRCGR